MGLYAPDPPAAPNPIMAAGAQTSSDVSTALANAHLNNANVIGPNGSTTFNQNGNFTTIAGPDGKTYNIPQYEQRTTLSPGQQQIYDQSVSNEIRMGQVAGNQLNKVGDILSSPINTNGIPGLVGSVNQPGLQTSFGANDFSADRKRVEDAMYARLEPRLQQDRASLDSRLRNQGLTPGSEAYNRAMDQTGRDATDARLQVIGAGGQEQSRLFSMDAQRAAFGNASLQQMYQNALEGANLNNQTAAQELQTRMAIRQAPLNEISALMSGSQVNAPQTVSYRPSNLAGTDVMGAIYNSAALNNQNYAQQSAQSNAMIGGLAGLGGSLITGGMAGGAGGFGSSLFGKIFSR
jgi:hypothetical protein